MNAAAPRRRPNVDDGRRNKRMVHTRLQGPEGLDSCAPDAVADVVCLNSRKILERIDCTYAASPPQPARRGVHVSGGCHRPYADRIGNGTLGEAFAGLTTSPARRRRPI